MSPRWRSWQLVASTFAATSDAMFPRGCNDLRTSVVRLPPPALKDAHDCLRSRNPASMLTAACDESTSVARQARKVLRRNVFRCRHVNLQKFL